MNHNRKLAYGAMMTAVFGLMLLINRMTGQLIETFLIYFYPMPILLYGAEFGWKSSLSVLVSMILLAFILSTPSGLIVAAGQAALGCLYGSLWHKNFSGKSIALITSIISSVFTYLQMIVFARFFGYDNDADLAGAEQLFYQLAAFFKLNVPAGFDVQGALIRTMRLAALLAGWLDGLVIHFFARILIRKLHVHEL